MKSYDKFAKPAINRWSTIRTAASEKDGKQTSWDHLVSENTPQTQIIFFVIFAYINSHTRHESSCCA